MNTNLFDWNRVISLLSCSFLLFFSMNLFFSCSSGTSWLKGDMLILDSCPELIIDQNDTSYYVDGYQIVQIVADRSYRESEGFEFRDTLSHDILFIMGSYFEIDSLMETENSYSSTLHLSYAYSVNHLNREHIILRFFDSNQFGSDVQGHYLIFEVNNGNAYFVASYIENRNCPDCLLKVVRSRKGVYLRSKNLTRMK
jgi:hypothetical protein